MAKFLSRMRHKQWVDVCKKPIRQARNCFAMKLLNGFCITYIFSLLSSEFNRACLVTLRSRILKYSRWSCSISIDKRNQFDPMSLLVLANSTFGWRFCRLIKFNGGYIIGFRILSSGKLILDFWIIKFLYLYVHTPGIVYIWWIRLVSEDILCLRLVWSLVRYRFVWEFEIWDCDPYFVFNFFSNLVAIN